MPEAGRRVDSYQSRIGAPGADSDSGGMQVSVGRVEARRSAAPERFASPGSVLEQGYVRARLARAPRVRVTATVLQTATMFVPAALALLYDVDEHGGMQPAMALRGSACGAPPTDELARRLVALEPVDPFSARRAQGMRSVALGAADVGGEEELSRSMFGRHLRRLGLGAPLHAYFWSGERIVAGLVLVRDACEPAFKRAECELLSRLSPLLADAVVLGRCPGGEVPVLPEGRLTQREREVAWLVVAGVSNAVVAERLDMSEATVKTHLTRINAKLGIRSRTELVTQFRRA